MAFQEASSEGASLLPVQRSNNGCEVDHQKGNHRRPKEHNKYLLIPAVCAASAGLLVCIASAWQQRGPGSRQGSLLPSVPSAPHYWNDEMVYKWEEFLLSTNHPKNSGFDLSEAAKVSLLAPVSSQPLATRAAVDKSKKSPLLYFNESIAFSRLDPIGDDFFRYQSGWEAQITQSLCAVATTAAMLNSLRDVGKDFVLPLDPVYVPFPWATQSNILDADDGLHGACVASALGGRSNAGAVRHIGLGTGTLPGFANCFLEPNGYHATGYHAGSGTQQTGKTELKQVVVDALRDPSSRVLLNYDRGGIGQGPMGHGHWSPLGAYHEETDSFLVMDVAKYKHPMVWVPWDDLWGGAATIDTCSTMVAPADGAPSIDWTKWSFAEIAKAIQSICLPGNRGFVVVSKTTT